MPLLGFQTKFSKPIEDLRKRQTIRAKRKDGKNPHVGDRLHCYAGLRTKACRKLGEFICLSVEEISITETADIFYQDHYLDDDEAQEMARDDGFKCFYEMFDFFKKVHGLPFYGLLIKW